MTYAKNQYFNKFKEKQFSQKLINSKQSLEFNENQRNGIWIKSQNNETNIHALSKQFFILLAFLLKNLLAQTIKCKDKYKIRSILPLILIHFAVISIFFPLTRCAIYSTNMNANQLSDFTIQLTTFDTDTTVATAGSLVLITFPKQFQAIQLYTKKPYTGYDGGVSNFCPSDCGAVIVDYSAYVFILKNMFPADSSIQFSYTIYGIKNPYYKVTTDDFNIQIIPSDMATQLFSQPEAGFDIDPEGFSSCTLTLDYPFLWSMSQLSMDISLTSDVNSLKIIFPQKWQNQTRVTDTLSTYVQVSSSTHQISFSKSTLTVTVNFPQIFSTQTMTLTIKSIYTPSSAMNLGPITIDGYNFKNQLIKQSLVSIPSNQLTFDSLRQLSTYLVYDTVNNRVQIRCKFKLPHDGIANDKFSIQYPSQISISTTASNYQVYVNNGLVAGAPGTPTILSGTNTIEIKPLATTLYQPTFEVAMKIPWPKTALFTSNFTIQSARFINSAYAPMQKAICCALWLKQKPTLTLALTVSNSQRLKSSIAYKFDITHKFTTLSSTDGIAILFPKIFALDSSKQATVCASITIALLSNPSNVNPSYVCTLANNALSLSNIFVANQVPALLSISLSITNPSTTPTQNFIVWSKDTAGARIQSGSLPPKSIVPASLSSVSITPGSFVTSKKINYQLSITSVGIVNKNSFVKITIPPQIKVLEYSINCQINSVPQFCVYDKTNLIVNVLTSATLASTSFQVNIINLVNPETVSPTANFKVEIYDPAGNLIESSSALSSGLSVQMTQFDSFLYQRMWFDKLNLDQKGNLQFLIATNRNLVPASRYKLDFVFTPGTAFNIDSTNSILTFSGSPIAFTPTNSTAQYSLSFIFTSALSSNIIQFSISQSFIFSLSLATNITLSKQISSVFYQSVTLSSTIKLQFSLNSILINDYSITQDTYFMNQSPGQITLKINTISPNITFSSVIVAIPKNYQSASGTYTYTSSSNTLTIPFTIADLLNPLEIYQEPFTFIIYDASNQIVGLSLPSNQYYQTKCTFPCRDCKSLTQPTLCSDCYQFSGNSMTLFRTTASPYAQCTDYCKVGQYLDSVAKKCLPCDPSCSSCLISNGGGSGDPLKCLACPVNNYLLSNKCYLICPDTYYSNSKICSSCIDNCAKCTSLNACTECIAPFVLYQGDFLIYFLGFCLQSCPLKTITSAIPLNPLLNQCLSCSANCLKCTDVNTCTLCDINYYLYNLVCQLACPVSGTGQQLFPNQNSICSACVCQSCKTYSYKCTSCLSPLILDGAKFKCLSKCQDGKFNNNGVCQPCDTNCLVCLGLNNCKICKQPYVVHKIDASTAQCLNANSCPTSTLLTIQTIGPSTHILQCLACSVGCKTCLISYTFCTQCSPNYYFLNNQCFSVCPAGYHNIGTKCQACVDQCQICDNNDATNCTQCKQGYFLQKNKCYVNCPAGTYRQTTLKKCLSCQTLCQTCMNATNCVTCKEGYFLFTNNLCYDKCPTTPVLYYMYNSQCLSCQPQCAKCLSTPTQCTSCSSSYFYQNQDTKQCATTCAKGYFISGSKCVKCQLPCATCDSTYSSCMTCFNNNNTVYKYLLKGECLKNCPDGYYGGRFTNATLTVQNVCLNCPFPCATCTSSRCVTCQTFAYMYKDTCVLDCSATRDMPFKKDTYCTSCISIPFCTFCPTTETAQLYCWSCVYPYVFFEGQCLNECPRNFIVHASDSGNSTCVESLQYTALKLQIYERNKPKLPFPFLIIFVGLSLIIYTASKFMYQFTYHIGYQIFLINLLDFVLIFNWLAGENWKYQGQYYHGSSKQLPLLLILGGILFNTIVLGWIAFGYVIKYVYLKDIRYQEWKNKNLYNFASLVALVIILGPRSHKLYYSKLFGFQNFAFRIISVEKFHLQDRINLLACLGDLLIVLAFFIVAYNIFIQYSVLYLTAFQIFILKIFTWILLVIDSKKPDRGFFYGDEKIALQEIQKEEEQYLTQLRRIDTDHLIKMIRIKSAGHLDYDKQPFGTIQKHEFMSVYDPNDFEQVPKVPLKRIGRNIQRGKFRKGRKITIQQKLQRFADTIKPKPLVAKAQQYLHGMIYWQPPKQLKKLKIAKVQPLSEQSMLKILEDKQYQYKEELNQIENIIFEQKQANHHNFRTGQFFYKNSSKNQNFDSFNFNDLEDSNASIQQFQDLSSQIFKPNQQIQYNDLMNLNYAKKKHLPKQQKKPQFDDNQMRILYHEPMKKRPSRIDDEVQS